MAEINTPFKITAPELSMLDFNFPVSGEPGVAVSG